MKRFLLIWLVGGVLLPHRTLGQSRSGERDLPVDASVPGCLLAVDRMPATSPETQPLAPAVAPVLPILSPELALETFERRTAAQALQLASYSAVTIIKAELPDTAQEGEYELQRHYAAPHTLLFKPIRFVGDKFVKSNVIAKLLQSEVDHVEKDDPARTAIIPANYKFSYKGESEVGDRPVQVFHVKPHKKRLGLFKGRIYLDAHTGALARVEGRAVKSPSFFVKSIEFVQDYADFDSFTLPVHMHSQVRARIVGRTIVDIIHRDYRPVPATPGIIPSL